MTTKYREMWDLMSLHNFAIDLEQFQDLKCVICQGILKNAYQGPCGCRYCLVCIQEYFSDNEVTCPGKSGNCPMNMANLQNFIQPDHPANRSVSMISVKCPYVFCYRKFELYQMKEHVQAHEQCPFLDVGCHEPVSLETDHLHNEVYRHSRIVVSRIGELQRQLDSGGTNPALHDAVRDLSVQLDGLRATHHEDVGQLRGAVTELMARNERMSADLAATKERCEQAYRDRGDAGVAFGMPTLEGDCRKRRRTDGSAAAAATMVMTPAMTTPMTTEPATKAESLLGESMALLKEPMAVTHALERHVFSFDQFSQMLERARSGIETRVTSASFDSANRYRLRLVLYPNGAGDAEGTHLSVAIQPVAGPSDTSLTWPIEHNVTFCLVDQAQPNRPFTKPSVEIRCSFARPDATVSLNTSMASVTTAIGPRRFIKLENLLGNPGWLKDDSIIVKLILQIA